MPLRQRPADHLQARDCGRCCPARGDHLRLGCCTSWLYRDAAVTRACFDAATLGAVQRRPAGDRACGCLDGSGGPYGDAPRPHLRSPAVQWVRPGSCADASCGGRSVNQVRQGCASASYLAMTIMHRLSRTVPSVPVIRTKRSKLGRPPLRRNSAAPAPPAEVVSVPTVGKSVLVRCRRPARRPRE